MSGGRGGVEPSPFRFPGTVTFKPVQPPARCGAGGGHGCARDVLPGTALAMLMVMTARCESGNGFTWFWTSWCRAHSTVPSRGTIWPGL
jgi:hypothetical protein